MKRALAIRDFRLLFAGMVLSMFGDSALVIVMGIWVKTITGSNAAAGLAFLVLALAAPLAPVGGYLVDRVRRRPFLIAANLVSALAVLPLLAVGKTGPVWVIYAVGLGYGISGMVMSAAMNGLLKEIVPDALLADANGASQTVREGLRLVGPLVGAGLFTAFGGGAVAVLDAATFVVAAATLTRLKVREARPEPPQHRFRAEVTAGARHLLHTEALRRVTISAAVAFLVIGFTETFIFAVVDEGLHRPPSFLGVLGSMQGVGAILGGLTAARIVRRIGEQAAVAAGLMLFAAGDVVLAFGNLGFAIAGVIVAGIGLPWALVGYYTLLQRSTPNRLMGRVSTASDVLLGVPQTISIGLGALLIGVVGYQVLIVSMAVVIAAAGVPLLRRPQPARVPVDVT
jgi:MFS family permease